MDQNIFLLSLYFISIIISISGVLIMLFLAKTVGISYREKIVLSYVLKIFGELFYEKSVGKQKLFSWGLSYLKKMPIKMFFVLSATISIVTGFILGKFNIAFFNAITFFVLNMFLYFYTKKEIKI